MARMNSHRAERRPLVAGATRAVRRTAPTTPAVPIRPARPARPTQATAPQRTYGGEYRQRTLPGSHRAGDYYAGARGMMVRRPPEQTQFVGARVNGTRPTRIRENY